MKALIIDDEPHVITVARILVTWERFGIHTVLSCSSSEEALDLIAQESPQIILSDINSRKVCLKHKGDDKLLSEVVFPEYSVLLLWHPLDSKMVCIEPWINLPDSKKDINVEFKNKKNIIKLEPYESKTLVRSISYL